MQIYEIIRWCRILLFNICHLLFSWFQQFLLICDLCTKKKTGKYFQRKRSWPNQKHGIILIISWYECHHCYNQKSSNDNKEEAHVAFTTFLPQLLTYGAYKFEATIKRIMTRRKKIMKYVFHFTSLFYVLLSLEKYVFL